MGEGIQAQFVGRYGQPGSPGLLIEAMAAGLAMRLPGAPIDAATALHATDVEDRFELGASGSGAIVQFKRDRGAVIALSFSGGLQLARHPDPDPPDYVAVPEPRLRADEVADFEALFQASVTPSDGRAIAYDLPHPRHAFLTWLCADKKLLAHGSNTADIALFEPRRKTLGLLREQSESGVSACADGLWAMAYAVLDRARMRGSFQNSVVPFTSASGAGRLYHFSIAHEIAAQRPFRNGVVYLFVRKGFSRLNAIGARLEWRADEAVRPVACLAVRPEDFPLLDAIRSHDDSAALRFVDLLDAMLQECRRALPLEDGYTLWFAPRTRLTRDVFALCDSLRRAYPWIDLAIRVPPDPADVMLTLRGSQGLRDVLDPKLRDKLPPDEVADRC